ncbi:DUF3667 domain-containing protein [Lacinutrix algicola]|uniref:DUF3667 domain-containing protein n=1 Tax=Lacinutrix algicola TaxID=342954 RepID=UPI0006E23EEA|nr:DUF3667 domain-containing protein [Lacinutrix algicola]
MSIQYKTCKNCENDFRENFDFCPHCGMNEKEKLTLGVLFYNTVSNYFSFDARFFKSFIPLLIKPGYLATKFVSGKRLLYLHPGQMYLFAAVLFFFLFSFSAKKGANEFDKGLSQSFGKNTKIDSFSVKASEAKVKIDSVLMEEARIALKKNSNLTGITDKQVDSLVNKENFNKEKNSFTFSGKKIDSLIEAKVPDSEILKEMGLNKGDSVLKKRLYSQALKFIKSKQGSGILFAFLDAAPIAMFFILPIFALILMLFYRKRGLYAHHLVFSFYYFAFLFTVFNLVIITNFIVDIPDYIDSLIVLSVFFYLIIALKKFYKQGWFKSFLKGSLSTMIFFPILIFVSAFVLLFSFMFY